MARWGALRGTTEVLDNRYSGAVFVRLGKSGHMFNQHYLSAMFPRHGGAGGVNGFLKMNGTASGFLDTVVDVDEEVAIRREDMAVGILGGEGRFEVGKRGRWEVKGGEKGEVKVGKRGEVLGEEGLMDGVCREVEGRSVRELSRLWLYLGGRSPKD